MCVLLIEEVIGTDDVHVGGHTVGRKIEPVVMQGKWLGYIARCQNGAVSGCQRTPMRGGTCAAKFGLTTPWRALLRPIRLPVAATWCCTRYHLVQLPCQVS